jgi:hypothetical protein
VHHARVFAILAAAPWLIGQALPSVPLRAYDLRGPFPTGRASGCMQGAFDEDIAG